MTYMKFLIHIRDIEGKHKIKEFQVPDAFIPNNTIIAECLEIASWYYLNYIDFESMTGPAEWSVFTKEMFV